MLNLDVRPEARISYRSVEARLDNVCFRAIRLLINALEMNILGEAKHLIIRHVRVEIPLVVLIVLQSEILRISIMCMVNIILPTYGLWVANGQWLVLERSLHFDRPPEADDLHTFAEG